MNFSVSLPGSKTKAKIRQTKELSDIRKGIV